jgi:RNA polymerase sigma factor (sigma-70 family)
MDIKTFKANDLELIDQIRSGSKKAEELLYSKYKRVITRYLRYKRYNVFDLEDCVSEILIKIFTNINKYDSSKSAFSTWVITIINNHVINKSKVYANNIQTISYGTSGTIQLNCSNSANTCFVTTNSNYDGTTTSLTTNNTFYTSDLTTINSIDNSSTLTMISSMVDPKDFEMLKLKYVDGYSYDDLSTYYNDTKDRISNRVNYVKSKIQKNKDKII